LKNQYWGLGGRMLNGKTEIELDINAESIRLIANEVIFYNATILLALYQHYLTIGECKKIRVTASNN
jgi:hypothetical protein